MKTLSPRFAFTGLMTALATIFSAAITIALQGGEADLLTDILKIAVLIAVGTAASSYIFWTLTHLKQDSLARGAAAGFFTAVTIIPLPSFVAVLKSQTFSAYQSEGLVSAVLSAVPTAIEAGLHTFVQITKASLIAIIASMILGVVITVCVAPKAAPAAT